MKLTDKTKKRLVVAGFGVVCAALVMAIASQLKTEEIKEALLQPSSTVAGEVAPNTKIAASFSVLTVPDVNVQPLDTASASSHTADTGDSSGTRQSIQPEAAKPTEPPRDAITDPTKTPNGKKVDALKPVEHAKVTKPERGISPSEPKSGDKKDGKIYVPGFGWVEDNGGGGSGTIASDMFENGNKIGEMD